jgi:alcohol dehydrogenase
VLEDYGSKVWKKLARLAEAAGVCPAGSPTDEEKAKAFIAAIYIMNAKMGIPRGFDFIKTDDIPRMIKWAAKESNPLYPVPVVYNHARYRKVIEQVMKNGSLK